MENTIDNQQLYDAKWSQWEDMKKYGPMSRWIRKLIHKLVDHLDYQTILDVGCGEGAELEQFKHQGKTISGSDFSLTGLEMARKKFPESDFFFLDLTKGLPDQKKYDLVICSEVLEHVTDLETSIDNLCSLSNNYIVITGPLGRMRPCETYVGHLRNLNLNQLENSLKRNGYTIERKFTWGFPLFSPIYRDLQNAFSRQQHQLSEGRYGFFQKAICLMIYGIFYLNLYFKGDQLVLLAKKTA